jgi:hypothetical protein
MITKLTDIQKLSVDAYNGNITNYGKSKDEANAALRAAINEVCGGTFNYYSFMDNKGKVFALVADMLSVNINYITSEAYNQIAEIRDVMLGDRQEFVVENNDLFRVASISNGNTDIRRQTILNQSFSVPTVMLAVKIYTELELFMAGRIDWVSMINRVALSFNNEVAVRIATGMGNAYSSLSAPYAQTGVYDGDVLATLITDVEIKTGQPCTVYGVKSAIRQIGSDLTVDNSSDMINNERFYTGYVGSFFGTPVVEMAQGLKSDGNYAYANDDLLIIPTGEKPVKIIFEGDFIIRETEEANTLQPEFFFGRKVGVSVVISSQFGMYRLT